MLPNPLLSALQRAAEKYSAKDLKESALSVSKTYRTAYRSGQHLVVSRQDVLSYASLINVFNI